jgi:hypothetical protein
MKGIGAGGTVGVRGNGSLVGCLIGFETSDCESCDEIEGRICTGGSCKGSKTHGFSLDCGPGSAACVSSGSGLCTFSEDK